MAAVSVTTTATRLDTATTTNPGGSKLVVHNTGTAVVYLGDSDVTADNGFPLAAGASLTLELRESGAAIYGVVAGPDPVEVRTLELGV